MKSALFYLLSLGVILAAAGPLALAGPNGENDAGTESESPSKVKYKEGKELNFDQLIIEGQMRRPELSVVTGDDEQGTNGLLKLREDFVDKMTADASEQIQ